MRLARILDADVSALPALTVLTPVERQELRHAVTDALLAEHRTFLTRLADSSALVPVALTVKIAQNVFGPRLAALVSGFLTPNRAASLIGKIPMDLLVEQTRHLDERILPALADKVATSVQRSLATALAAERDYVTLANLLCAVPAPVLAELLAHLSDVDVLAVAAVAADPRDRSRIVDTHTNASTDSDCWTDTDVHAEAATRLATALPGLDEAAAASAIAELLTPAAN